MRNDMTETRYTGPPMTLGNLRANGVRSLDVSCSECHHSASTRIVGPS